MVRNRLIISKMPIQMLSFILVLISSYCLCFIAVDRYRNIVKPTREPWTTRRAHSLMAVSWLTSATVSSPLFITQRLQPLALENTTLCGYVSSLLLKFVQIGTQIKIIHKLRKYIVLLLASVRKLAESFFYCITIKRTS